MIATLEDFEFQFTDTGILMNSDAFGSADAFLDVKDVKGLDSANFKLTTKSYDGRDGGIAVVSGREMREIEISGDLVGGSDPIEPLLDALKANFAPTNVNLPLYFKAPGINMRQVFCKSLGFKYSWTAARRLNCTPFSIKFIAEDPVVYGTTQYTTQVAKGQAATGHSFDHAFDYSFGGSASSGGAQIWNNGNLDVGFLFTVTGQSTINPVLVAMTQDKQVAVNLSVGSSDTLVIDFYNENVRLNGVPRRNAVTQEGWFLLKPGLNELTLLDSSALSVSGTVSYYDGYE